jgi:putative DNA primase/helicase
MAEHLCAGCGEIYVPGDDPEELCRHCVARAEELASSPWEQREERRDSEPESQAGPPDPFSEVEMRGLLAEFFGTDKPTLDAADPDLEAVSEAAWDVLRQSNISPVTIFRVGGIPSRLEFDDAGAPVVRILTTARLRQEMAARAVWFKGPGLGDLFGALQAPDDPESTKLLNKLTACRPPKEIIENMLAQPDIFLPVLERIVEAPVFAPDGTIETSPGYHAGSRTYYAGRGLKLRQVRNVPTVSEEDEALGLLTELLQDFPFVSEADRLTAIAAMLGPFVRSMIDGPTPLHLIEAPTPGTGKGLLADVISIPATGRLAATITEARGEEEWRKRITAVLRNGRPVTLIDNLQGRLDSAALSAAITSPLWTDRLLGASELVAYPVTTIWLATGNNPALSREIARRTIRCRMDAGVERPESRTGFRHELPEWAYEHRAELVWALLTLTRSWMAAGRRPWSGISLGSLESWCRTVGGILENVGLTEFLGNLEAFRAEADEETIAWRSFVESWWDKHGDTEVPLSDLFDLARERLPLRGDTLRAQETNLGLDLRAQRDRRYGDLVIRRRALVRGHRLWQLDRRS